MSSRHPFAQLALGLACLSICACGSEPSFRVDWRIATSADTLDAAEQPGSIAECTARGIGGVRIETIEAGVTLDMREYDCFVTGKAKGPSLSAGEYTVEVTGLRRNGTEWACVVPNDTIAVDSCEGALNCSCNNDLDCDAGLSCAIIEGSNELGGEEGETGGDTGDDGDDEAPFIRVCHPCSARHVQQVSIADEQTTDIEAILIAPPQCDDGIDNDLDGLTDLLDPACARDATAREDADKADTVVSLGTSFLNDNPNANCDLQAADAFPLDVTRFEAQISSAGEVVDTRILTCQRNLSVYSLELPGGEYTLALTGYAVSPLTDPEALPVTVAKTLDFSVSADNGGFVGESFDFAGEDFVPAITGSLSFSASFDIGGSVPNTGINRGCSSTSGNNSSPLVIDTLLVTVLDASGEAVDPTTLGLVGTPDPDSGGVLIACPDSGNAAVTTDVLSWGAYEVQVEGRVQGATCFAETLFPLPNSQLTQPIDRVLVDGVPPAGCEDCQVAADCPSNFPMCVDNLCVGLG